MALPTFVGVGTAKADTLPIATVPWPAGHQAGDYGLLVIETAAQAPGNNPPSGWSAVPVVSPQSTGTAGAAGATALYVYERFATSSSEAAADIGDSGDHQLAYILAFRGTDPTTARDVAAGAVQASASTSVSWPSVTTTGADRLIVLIGTNAANTSTSQFSGVTNAALANIANRKNQQSGVGVGGGLVVWTGEKATAGATGATTATLATASAQALITLALKPPTGTPSGTFGGFYVATGVKQTAGATGASTGNLQTAQVQAAITIALKPPTPVVNLPPVLDAVPDFQVVIGSDLDVTLTATDPEAQAMTWALNPGSTLVPSGISIDNTGRILWTPIFIHQGVWNLTARVTDAGGLFDEQTFNITVTGGPPNATDIATRAQVDVDSAQALLDALLAQEQTNAVVTRKAQELLSDLITTKGYLDAAIADLQAQGT